MVVGGASGEIFAQRVAGVETREEREVFLFRLRAAEDARELGGGERIGGNGERTAVGAGENLAGGVALVVAGGVVERASAVEVGLLGAEAADELEAIFEEADIAADEAGDDPFAGEARVIDVGNVGGGGDRGELRGRGLEKLIQAVVADSLGEWKAERCGLLRDGRVEKARRGIVVADGRSAGAAIGADEGVGRLVERVVALGDEPVEAAFKGERNRAAEIAAGGDVGVAAEIGDDALGAVGGGERVRGEAVRIDGGTGGAIGDGDAIGAAGVVGLDFVERHGESGAAGSGVEEASDLDVDVVVDVGGGGAGGLEFPDGAAVIPEEGGHGGLVDALAALGSEDEFGGAGATARGRE